MFNKILIAVFVLATMATAPIGAEDEEFQIVEEGLVSYWSFSNVGIAGEGIARDLKGNNDGIVKGDPQVVPGIHGQALLFDGDGDHVDCGKDPSIDFDKDDAFSAGAWVKVDKKHDNHMVIIGKMLAYGSNSGWALWFRGLSVAKEGRVDHMQLVLRHHMWEDNGEILRMSDSPVPRGEWMHLVMTYDGSGASVGANLYLNGERMPLGGSKTVSDTIKVDTSLNIGARGTDKGQMPHYFAGIIDEVFIYNRELTEKEVKQNFASEVYAVDSVDKLATNWGAIKVSR